MATLSSMMHVCVHDVIDVGKEGKEGMERENEIKRRQEERNFKRNNIIKKVKPKYLKTFVYF